MLLPKNSSSCCSSGKCSRRRITINIFGAQDTTVVTDDVPLSGGGQVRARPPAARTQRCTATIDHCFHIDVVAWSFAYNTSC